MRIGLGIIGLLALLDSLDAADPWPGIATGGVLLLAAALWRCGKEE